MTTRMVIKEMARQEGVFASFMPKPLGGVQGSGMHTHIALWEGDAHAFVDDQDRYGLSEVARRFIAGLLHHAREITAVTNQWVNSYKRLIGGYEAPVHVSWARNNRWCWCASPWSRWARRSRPASSTGRPTAPATPTWPSW